MHACPYGDQVTPCIFCPLVRERKGNKTECHFYVLISFLRLFLIALDTAPKEGKKVEQKRSKNSTALPSYLFRGRKNKPYFCAVRFLPFPTFRALRPALTLSVLGYKTSGRLDKKTFYTIFITTAVSNHQPYFTGPIPPIHKYGNPRSPFKEDGSILST